MSAHRSKGSGLEWYVRRGGTVRGPFSSAKVRHYVLEGRLEVSDEVSADRQSWSKLGSVAEVVPLQMRSTDDGLHDEHDGQRRRDRRQALRAITVSVVLIGALVSVVLLVGSGQEQPQRDCAVAPQAGVFLEGCDLSHAALESAELQGARLANSKLRNAKLSTADLREADMRYADLAAADLSYARLSSVVLLGASLRRADLTNADLRAADLSFADLSGARLGGARLEGAVFEGAIWLDGARCGKSDCPR